MKDRHAASLHFRAFASSDRTNSPRTGWNLPQRPVDVYGVRRLVDPRRNCDNECIIEYSRPENLSRSQRTTSIGNTPHNTDSIGDQLVSTDLRLIGTNSGDEGEIEPDEEELDDPHHHNAKGEHKRNYRGKL